MEVYMELEEFNYDGIEYEGLDEEILNQYNEKKKIYNLIEVKSQSVGFKADAKLQDFATKKVNKLDTFSDVLQSAEVFFKLINTPSEENKEVEISVKTPGKELFAKKAAKSFEEATDLATDALRNQIEKMKGKQEKK